MVLAMRNGKILFKEAYGLANIELAVPMNPNHVFKIGSMSKQFTAIAIMKGPPENLLIPGIQLKSSPNQKICSLLKVEKVPLHFILTLWGR